MRVELDVDGVLLVNALLGLAIGLWCGKHGHGLGVTVLACVVAATVWYVVARVVGWR